MKNKKKPFLAPLGLPSAHKFRRHPTKEAHENPFPILKLPMRGTELRSGRQYELTSLARLTAKEEFGLTLPKTVTCISAKHEATESITITSHLESGRTTCSETMHHPAVLATFQAFLGPYNIKKFTLDLEKLWESEKNYKFSPKLQEFEKKNVEKVNAKVREYEAIDVDDLFD